MGRANRGARARGCAAVIAAALALAGCGDEERQGTVVEPPSASKSTLDPCERPGAERRKRFKVTDRGFRPTRVVVQSGGPVTFVNCGRGPHTVSKASGRGEPFDSGTLQRGEEFDKTFVSVGTHRIIDRHNPDAEMIVEVEGFEIPPQG
jgi:plastocyanin